jgi:hypothetical protein
VNHEEFVSHPGYLTFDKMVGDKDISHLGFREKFMGGTSDPQDFSALHSSFHIDMLGRIVQDADFFETFPLFFFWDPDEEKGGHDFLDLIEGHNECCVLNKNN